MTQKIVNVVLPAAAMWLGLFGLLTPAGAGSPEGVWMTEPDRKGQTAYVDASKCGAAYCGTIIKVFSRSGAPVAAPTVGKRVFWDMIPSSNAYQGRAYVPAHNRNYDATMQVSGNRMKVSGCLGPVCQSQIWTRVR